MSRVVHRRTTRRGYQGRNFYTEHWCALQALGLSVYHCPAIQLRSTSKIITIRIAMPWPVNSQCILLVLLAQWADEFVIAMASRTLGLTLQAQ
eukprot:1717657-Rhodomonas_salina.2